MSRFRARTKRLLDRVRKLAQAQADADVSVTLILGHVKRLPPDYVGERHAIITKELGIRNGYRWVEYTEVPGPKPEPTNEGDEEPCFPGPRRHLIHCHFVAPHPRPDQEERQGAASGITPQPDEDRD